MSEAKIWSLPEVAEQEPISSDEKVKRTLLAEGKDFTAFLLQAQPNQKPYLHVHENHDELVYIIEGEGEFILGDTTKRAKPGDLLYFPKGVVHGPNLLVKGVRLSIYIPHFDPNNPDRKEV